MNADTITIDQIKSLALAAKATAASLDLIAHMASIGDLGPEEAAAKVAELVTGLSEAIK
jgi:hypothetical protein